MLLYGDYEHPGDRNCNKDQHLKKTQLPAPDRVPNRANCPDLPQESYTGCGGAEVNSFDPRAAAPFPAGELCLAKG
jgi:hypothetical protein